MVASVSLGYNYLYVLRKKLEKCSDPCDKRPLLAGTTREILQDQQMINYTILYKQALDHMTIMVHHYYNEMTVYICYDRSTLLRLPQKGNENSKVPTIKWDGPSIHIICELQCTTMVINHKHIS